MRLILRYEESDGCTYSCTHTLPVEYDSAEALLVDFLEAAKAALQEGRSFKFLGTEFYPNVFYEAVNKDALRRLPDATYVDKDGRLYLEVAPSVLTLDEFFADALRTSPPQRG